MEPARYSLKIRRRIGLRERREVQNYIIGWRVTAESIPYNFLQLVGVRLKGKFADSAPPGDAGG